MKNIALTVIYNEYTASLHVHIRLERESGGGYTLWSTVTILKVGRGRWKVEVLPNRKRKRK
jgi:hypothetical protein